VQFQFLTAPIRFHGNDEGWVEGMECLRMELGEPGEDGRRRPVPIQGSEFILAVGGVVVAVGTSPNPLLLRNTPDLKTGRHGGVIVDPETRQTNRPGVFAGGDAIGGDATVIKAMGDGKAAARSIHQYLTAGAPA
jgi:glutamate synthase (NADPH/NADH) small chain